MNRRPPKITATDISLMFGLPILAYSEVNFGMHVLGLPSTQILGVTVSLALAVPGFLDTYVITAFRRGGIEVAYALALVITSVVGGAVTHLFALPPQGKVLASAAFGVVLAVVLWRVKTMAHHDSPEAQTARANAQKIVDLTTTISGLHADLARGQQALARAEQANTSTGQVHDTAMQQLRDQLAEREHDLTEARHQHDLTVVRLREQLNAARAAAAAAEAGNVVPIRPRGAGSEEAPGDQVETQQASDQAVLDVLKPLVRTNPKLGRPTALNEVRTAGLACGSNRVRGLLDQARAEVEAENCDNEESLEATS